MEPPLKLMLTKEAVANAALVIPTGNPLAKFLVCFLAKIVGVSFVAHVGARSNVKVRGWPPRTAANVRKVASRNTPPKPLTASPA